MGFCKVCAGAGDSVAGHEGPNDRERGARQCDCTEEAGEGTEENRRKSEESEGFLVTKEGTATKGGGNRQTKELN